MNIRKNEIVHLSNNLFNFFCLWNILWIWHKTYPRKPTRKQNKRTAAKKPNEKGGGAPSNQQKTPISNYNQHTLSAQLLHTFKPKSDRGFFNVCATTTHTCSTFHRLGFPSFRQDIRVSMCFSKFTCDANALRSIWSSYQCAEQTSHQVHSPFWQPTLHPWLQIQLQMPKTALDARMEYLLNSRNQR